MKSYRMARIISILVIVCITIVSTICTFIHVSLPDALIRIFGILDLCSVVVLVFTSVRLRGEKKEK